MYSRILQLTTIHWLDSLVKVLDIKERMRPKLVEERERRRIQLTEEVTQASIIAVQARLEEEARRKIKEERKCFQLSSIRFFLCYFSPFVIAAVIS